jgi:hypothetical protein
MHSQALALTLREKFSETRNKPKASKSTAAASQPWYSDTADRLACCNCKAVPSAQPASSPVGAVPARIEIEGCCKSNLSEIIHSDLIAKN